MSKALKDNRPIKNKEQTPMKKTSYGTTIDAVTPSTALVRVTRIRKPGTRNMILELLIIMSSLLILTFSPAAHASTAYGTLNNFDCVNDTGVEAHGFEIELDDVHSTDITYTYDYNHYGIPKITEDTFPDPVTGLPHPRVFIRYAAAQKPDGTWTAFTSIPTGPITPTDGHQFTNPSVNFGGEHFGAGYYGAPTAVKYNWLIDDGTGNLVHGPPVYVSTPTFTYYPPAPAQPLPQVQAVIVPPPPPDPPVLQFGEATWVKDIKTTTHNANKVELTDLIDPDPENPAAHNWANGEPAEVETEWRILQTEFANAGNPKGELQGIPEDLPGGDEIITRRYEFYKYTGPIDAETGEAMADLVAPDGMHGVGTVTYAVYFDPITQEWVTETVDLTTIVVVGEFFGAQMSGFDVAPVLGLIDHIPDGELNVPYPERTVVVPGGDAFFAATSGSLPDGMTLGELTGIFSGTPTSAGVFTFTVNASDTSGALVSKTYTVTIPDGVPATGTITTSPSSIEGGSTTGDGVYNNGTQLSVVATHAAGFAFENWTENGVPVSDSEVYPFTVNGDRNLVANFIPVFTAISISDAAITEGNAGTVTLSFEVTLSASSAHDVTVHYETANDTAMDSDNDYDAANSSITIPSGNTTGTIDITIHGDSKYEVNEKFFVNLTSATNGTIVDNQATGAINNDDTLPALKINDKTVTEPASGTGTVDAVFTVTVMPASGAEIKVTYATANGTALSGEDYNEITTTLLTIPEGATTGTIKVQVLGDGKAEGSETYFVNLTLPVGATISDPQGKGTISNRTPGLSINDTSLSEGNSGTSNMTFTVTPNFIYNAAISVNYAAQNGTAIQPGDYTITSGTLNIPANEASGMIDVPIVGDTLAEADETLKVVMSGSVNARISDNTGIGTIVNDDGALPTLTIDDVSVTEGNAGAVNATFTVTQSFATGSNTTFKFATSNGSAKPPNDFAGKSLTITIPEGSTFVQVNVVVNGDTLYEADETFNVNLSNSMGATIADSQGIGTILNDDTAPTISINDVTAYETEANQMVTFTLTLSQVSGTSTAVKYSTQDGTAVSSTDYSKKTNASLTIAAGALSKTFTVTVKGDAIAESTESFFVNLGAPTNATILDGQGECTIYDND
jgi:Calx-beta domain/Putative Ig domain/Divergent InlB B-repeat domain